MAPLRRSPSHAEGGMFMLPPTQDRAHPYGRAPPDAAHGTRPKWPDRLRPALPSPHYSRRTGTQGTQRRHHGVVREGQALTSPCA
jgi:hypothetical protein